MRISSPRPSPRSTPSERSSTPSPLGRTSTAAAARRPPEQAVTFTTAFHERLALPPQRLEEKKALMRESASAFFRMMPALFHEDLRGSWRDASRLLDRPAPRVPVVGDMHIGNLGTIRGPKGEAVWGLNDFDQATPGSPEVDLTRLAVSAALTAREAGLEPKEQAKAVEALANAYWRELERLAGRGKNPGAFLSKKEAKGEVDDLIAKAQDASPRDLLKEYTRTDSRGQVRFQSSDTLHPVSAETHKALRAALVPYEVGLRGADGIARPLEVLDWAQRLDAGGSSYGLERYYALVRAKQPDAPPVMLELKELLAPSLARPPVPADGALVVKNQAGFGSNFNPLTGATTVSGRAFLVRELEPEKAKLDDKALTSEKELLSAFTQAGVVLARAHGSTQARAASLVKWVGEDSKEATRRLVSFARGYADQVQADWGASRTMK
ncbi:DUF2252 family protein [Archangium lansingense]|uniref:DUF2252 family protein n=1 Tax=Archangium lansingense TaxID=2995310 RepID=A0ABT4AB37_9BACT|nr:DUF2252 family protein [Archangium lansinium]MCY1078886.1 DUF2252 family protein [Archangium lansinium]